jgi:hypothetical protein
VRQQRQQGYLLSGLLLLFLLLSACSTQQEHSDDDFLMGTNDPFADSFFTDGQQWDSSALKQSEVLSQQDVPKDIEEPTTWVEKSEALLMGTIIVGGGVAKMLFLPMLGL